MDLILSRDKTDVEGLLLKAGILLKQKNAADAKEICRNIFEDHPDHVENAVFLSSLYSQDKEYTEAITVLDTALESNPDNQSLLSMLGNTLYLNKDYERSEQVWQKILDAHPETFQNHLTLALFYQRTDQTAKAEQVLRAAIAADEKDAERKLALIDFIQHNASKDNRLSPNLKLLSKTIVAKAYIVWHWHSYNWPMKIWMALLRPTRRRLRISPKMRPASPHVYSSPRFI